MTTFARPADNLSQAIQQTILLLEKEHIRYFLLGGLAVGVTGEPRFTYDVDVDIFVDKRMVAALLQKLCAASFRVNVHKAIEDIQQFGTFRVHFGEVPIDCILASTALETSALKRAKKKAVIPSCKAYVPSPEDLILLKIIPGRPKDLIDAASIVARHGARLDRPYLERWARTICDEAEDFRIWHRLQELLHMR